MISHTSVNKEPTALLKVQRTGRGSFARTLNPETHFRRKFSFAKFQLRIFQNWLFSNLFFQFRKSILSFNKKKERYSNLIELTLQEKQVQAGLWFMTYLGTFFSTLKKAIITHLMPAKDFEALKYKKGRAKLGVRFALRLFPRARVIFCLQPHPLRKRRESWL